MLIKFEKDLETDKSLNSKHIPHYIRWISAVTQQGSELHIIQSDAEKRAAL